MIIKLFKIFFGVLLVVALTFLFTSRELALFKYQQKSNLLTVKHQPALKKSNTVVATSTPPDTIPADETLERAAKPIETSQQKQPNAIVQKINTPVAQTVSDSDTDESYIPVLSPCKTPMGYTIGVFDTKFGISKSTFIDEINMASSLWEKAYGKKLFYYNENAPLTINLIYDERQARTEEINNLSLEIENAKVSADTLHNAYEQEKVVYSRDQDQLIKDTTSFQERQKAYKAKVETYNTSGGAQKLEYDAMMNELTVLKEDFASIEVRRASLLSFMEAINIKVAKYNEIVIYINDLVRRSNELGANKFTEGRFRPAVNVIDIYQYDNITKLRRVIAHELGHVLGINHTSNLYSIMYAMNTATTTELSPEDKQALSQVCP